MEIEGKYAKAIIYTNDVEKEALEQIKNLCDHIQAKDAHIRLMPDVHAGAGCVVGYTAKINDYLIPNLIGVDIGCGVLTKRIPYIIKDRDDFFQKLDDTIKREVPSGFGAHTNRKHTQLEEMYSHSTLSKIMDLASFEDQVTKLANAFKSNAWTSLGTLGGGNHFIEVEQEFESNKLWLTIHTGSRSLGLKVAKHHQSQAISYVSEPSEVLAELRQDKEVCVEKQCVQKVREEITKILRENGENKLIGTIFKNLKHTSSSVDPLAFVVGEAREAYARDMKVAQTYAQLNRACIQKSIFDFIHQYAEKNELELITDPEFADQIESVHNYIDFETGFIRKGAISAQAGEKIVIPLNMKEGVVIGVGKGNPEWNFSAPHGAGRRMSRTQAKNALTMQQYEEDMQGIWSSCVVPSTIDEAPGAYKDVEGVLGFLQQSVDVKYRLKSVYNFKATEEVD